MWPQCGEDPGPLRAAGSQPSPGLHVPKPTGQDPERQVYLLGLRAGQHKRINRTSNCSCGGRSGEPLPAFRKYALGHKSANKLPKEKQLLPSCVLPLVLAEVQAWHVQAGPWLRLDHARSPPRPTGPRVTGSGCCVLGLLTQRAGGYRGSPSSTPCPGSQVLGSQGQAAVHWGSCYGASPGSEPGLLQVTISRFPRGTRRAVGRADGAFSTEVAEVSKPGAGGCRSSVPGSGWQQRGAGERAVWKQGQKLGNKG